MKKLLFILFLFLCAFSFLSVMPPGWVQLTLPINDEVRDICFTDTLNGWIVTLGDNSPVDTGYIMHTTNGGQNWTIQFSHPGDFSNIQFLDNNTGYAYGFVGFIRFYKTTNGGLNWQNLSAGVPLFYSSDMQFLNKDTGWICSDDPTISGGLAKTTNGGINWVLQLGQSVRPKKLFFINADTGWALGNSNNLYRTTNGGNSWSVQYSFNQTLRDLFMVNSDTGWVIINNPDQLLKTTNGGNNWLSQIKPPPEERLNSLYFFNGIKGWIGGGFGKILKTFDGVNWYNQAAPNESYDIIFFLDTLHGYAGGTKMIKTTDGGGPILPVEQTSTETPENFKLYQNYPNPFNPKTIINYQLSATNYVNLSVYDIKGRSIATLVNERQSVGTYQYTFDADGLPSGIYFYSLQTESFTDVKKMVLVK